MRRPFLAGLVCGLLVTAAEPSARQDGTVTLQIDVTDTTHADGSAGIALWAGEEGFPEEIERALRTIYVPVVEGQARATFEDLEPGDYAVTVFNDQDQDEEFDRNWLGMPRESWGVSNNVRPRLRAPRYDEAVFGASGGCQVVAITIE